MNNNPPLAPILPPSLRSPVKDKGYGEEDWRDYEEHMKQPVPYQPLGRTEWWDYVQ